MPKTTSASPYRSSVVLMKGSSRAWQKALCVVKSHTWSISPEGAAVDLVMVAVAVAVLEWRRGEAKQARMKRVKRAILDYFLIASSSVVD